MVETSLFWGGTATGDASLAPYDDDEFTDVVADWLVYDRTVQGVLQTNRTGYTGLLAVTNVGLSLRVATGVALVDGKLYRNSDTVALAGYAPSGGVNYFSVVLRKDFVAQTVRLALLANALNSNGGASTAAGYPAVTQNDGTLWEIELARVTINSASTVTITDVRQYVGHYRVDDVTLEEASGVLQIKDDGVDTDQLADGAVTEDKHDASVDYGTYHPFHRNANDSIQADNGGNARGAQAIDLQQNRSVATQVASGADSMVVGQSNTASGIASIASGVGSTASAAGAFAHGLASQATAEYATALGASTASGTFSVAFGGSVADKYCQIASGHYTNQLSIMSASIAVLHSDAAWYRLYLDDTSEEITVPQNSAWHFDILLAGIDDDGSKAFAYRIVGLIKNVSGTTTLVYSAVTETYDGDDASFNARVAADNTNDSLAIEVQDSDGGGDYVSWTATVVLAQAMMQNAPAPPPP